MRIFSDFEIDEIIFGSVYFPDEIIFIQNMKFTIERSMDWSGRRTLQNIFEGMKFNEAMELLFSLRTRRGFLFDIIARLKLIHPDSNEVVVLGCKGDCQPVFHSSNNHSRFQEFINYFTTACNVDQLTPDIKIGICAKTRKPKQVYHAGYTSCIGTEETDWVCI